MKTDRGSQLLNPEFHDQLAVLSHSAGMLLSASFVCCFLVHCVTYSYLLIVRQTVLIKYIHTKYPSYIKELLLLSLLVTEASHVLYATHTFVTNRFVAFANLQEATFSLVRSVCQSVRLHGISRFSLDEFFIKDGVSVPFESLSRTFNFNTLPANVENVVSPE